MSVLSKVSRMASGAAGGAARRRGRVPAARRPMGAGTGMRTGGGRKASQAAAAGGMLSRFLRRR